MHIEAAAPIPDVPLTRLPLFPSHWQLPAHPLAQSPPPAASFFFFFSILFLSHPPKWKPCSKGTEGDLLFFFIYLNGGRLGGRVLSAFSLCNTSCSGECLALLMLSGSGSYCGLRSLVTRCRRAVQSCSQHPPGPTRPVGWEQLQRVQWGTGGTGGYGQRLTRVMG